MTKKRILFIHKNYPAQFGALGGWLSQQGWDVTFATARKDVTQSPFDVVKFESHREGTEGIHQYLVGVEEGIIAGQGFARTAISLRNNGYVPDVVVAHSGWGVGTFVKDIWPQTAFVPYLEWFYASPAKDVTPHDKKPGDPVDHSAKTRVRNTPFWLDMSGASVGLCPTNFQASQFPPMLLERMMVMHDGIDTDLHKPGPRNPELMEELGIPMDAKILTWVTRGMEPARGFPEMMAALSELQKKHDNLHTIIVGEDRVAYGAKGAGSWKDKMLAAHEYDLSRIHFTGLVSRNRMIEVLRAGDTHLYLTAPFVLSWSMLDAMSCGAKLVASDVAPVREFIEDGKNGFLVDTYDHKALVNKVSEVLMNDANTGEAARELIVNRYDAKSIIYPAKEAFFSSLIEPYEEE